MVMLFFYTSSWAKSAERGLSVESLMRNIGIATALIAIVVLLLVEFLFRNRLPRDTYHWMLFMGLFLLPALVLLSTTTTVLEETKTVRSCATCHVMTPFVNDLKNPSSSTLAAQHFKNKWIPEHECYSCHTTYGVHGTLASKRDGFRHWLLYVTRTWETPIQYSGTYANSNCMACHVGNKEFESVKSHKALASDLDEDRVGCISCHGQPHPIPTEHLPVEKDP